MKCLPVGPVPEPSGSTLLDVHPPVHIPIWSSPWHGRLNANHTGRAFHPPSCLIYLGSQARDPGVSHPMDSCSRPLTPKQPQFLSKHFLFHELIRSLQTPERQVEEELHLPLEEIRDSSTAMLVIDAGQDLGVECDRSQVYWIRTLFPSLPPTSLLLCPARLPGSSRLLSLSRREEFSPPSERKLLRRCSFMCLHQHVSIYHVSHPLRDVFLN